MGSAEGYCFVLYNLSSLISSSCEVLKLLATHSGQVFTREQILKNVWGYDYYGDLRSVDVTIRRIREKIEDNTAEPKYIITKRGIGYYV